MWWMKWCNNVKHDVCSEFVITELKMKIIHTFFWCVLKFLCLYCVLIMLIQKCNPDSVMLYCLLKMNSINIIVRSNILYAACAHHVIVQFPPLTVKAQVTSLGLNFILTYKLCINNQVGPAQCVIWISIIIHCCKCLLVSLLSAAYWTHVIVFWQFFWHHLLICAFIWCVQRLNDKLYCLQDDLVHLDLPPNYFSDSQFVSYKMTSGSVALKTTWSWMFYFGYKKVCCVSDSQALIWIR